MSLIKPGYTRISEILQQWDTYGHIDKTTLENKAALGTQVHEAIKDHIESMYTPLEAKAAGYFDSYVKWENAVKPKIINSEQRYYCDDLKITGQIDAVMHIPGDGLPCVVDFKTSASENAKMWPLQACFYHYLAKKNGLQISQRLLFIKLNKTGSFPMVIEYEATDYLWEICVSAWKCYTYINKP